MQLKDLRALLRGAGRSEEGAALFTSLYRSWCHSLGAVLSLCFLIEARCCSCLALHCTLPLLIMDVHCTEQGVHCPS